MSGPADIARFPTNLATADAPGAMPATEYTLAHYGAKATVSLILVEFSTWADGMTIVTPTVGSKTLQVTTTGDIDIRGLSEADAKAFLANYLSTVSGSVVDATIAGTSRTLTLTAKSYGPSLNGVRITGSLISASVAMAGGLSPQLSHTPKTSRMVVEGSPETDCAQLGPELTSATGWTSAGWTGSYNAFAHTTGNTSALSYDVGAVAGDFLLVAITISGRTAGSLSAVSVGDSPAPEGYDQNIAFYVGPKATGVGALTITPTADFDGTLAVSVKRILPISATQLSLRDSSGARSIEFSQLLSGNSSLFIGGALSGGTTRNGAYQIAKVGGVACANTGVGIEVLSEVTTGWDNAGFGNVVLAHNTTGFRNTGVGVDVLNFNTIGYDNTAVGHNVLSYNISGYENTAVGLFALANNTTGHGNTAIGHSALLANVTGDGNTAVGKGALLHSTGSLLTAVGMNALQSNTTGTANCAVGAGALHANTTGVNNLAFGFNALGANTVGSNNTVLGVSALLNGTNPIGCVAIGYNALQASTTGSENTAVGTQAMLENTSGYYNTAFGTNAGRSFTNNDRCTFVGRGATTSVDNLTNAIAIGYNAVVGASNTMVLGLGVNVVIGATAAGASAIKCLALSNSATAPSASADLCHLYSADNGAGHATLAIFAEETVQAIGTEVIKEFFPVFINGTVKHVALCAVP